MSNAYLLCPPEPTDWHIELETFAAALAARWPHAMINRDATHASRAINWELNLGGSAWLDASLDRDGQATHFRGDPELIADYVLWFRAEHPEPELVLIHDADGDLHDISTNTTRDEVLGVL